MSAQITFLINNEPADYFDSADFPVALNRDGVSLKDPSKRKVDRTFTLKLPVTKRNKRLIGNLNDFQTINKFKNATGVPCKLIINETTLIDGIFYVTKAKVDEYEGFVVQSNTIGNTTNFASGTLRDLNLGRYEDYWGKIFEGTIDIRANMDDLNTALQTTGPYTHNERTIIFPLISYGNYFVPNRWADSTRNVLTTTTYIPNGTTLTPPIPETSSQPADGRVWNYVDLPEFQEINGSTEYPLNLGSNAHIGLGDLPPSVYVTEIVKAIFEDAGYQLRGSWINEEEVKRLIMPFTSDRNFIWNWETLGALGEFGGLIGYQDGIISAISRLAIISTSPPADTGSITVGYFDNIEYASASPTPGAPSAPFNQVYTYYNIFDFATCIDDKGFNTIKTSYTGNGQLDIPNDAFYQGYLAPVTAEYRFRLEYQCDDNQKYESKPSFDVVFPTEITDIWNNRTIGFSKIEGGSLPTYLDGEITVRQDQFGDNIDNVIAFRDATNDVAAGIYSLETDWVELEANTQVVAWLASIMPVAYTDSIPRNNAGNPVFNGGETTSGVAFPPGFFLSANAQYNENGSNLEYTASNVVLRVEARPIQDIPEEEQFSDDLIIAQNLPKVKQIDFLKSLIKLFNLYLILDDSSKIAYLDRYDNFFQSSVNAYDITKKTSEEYFEFEPPDLARITNFLWIDDSDDFLATGKSEDWSISFDSEIGQNTDTVDIDSGVFSGTALREYLVIEDTRDTATGGVLQFTIPDTYNREIARIFIPTIADQETIQSPQNEIVSNKYKWRPRLLQLKGVYDLGITDITNGLKFRVFDDSISPFGGPYPVNRQTGQRFPREIYQYLDIIPRVGFADNYQDPILTNTQLSYSGINGLYIENYQQQYTLASQSELLELEMFMDSRDWNSMQLNVPVVYNGVLYQLIKIQGYNPTKNNLTKVTLLRIK